MFKKNTKLDKPSIKVTNPNYCATIIKINQLLKLEGLDNLKGVNIWGFQALVPNNVKVGDLMIMFTAETQLDEQYCHQNNLFTDPSKNKDGTKGYLTDKRRVKAIKLRGNTSSALLMPLSSLDYLGVDTTQLREGMSFNEIDGIEICKKYKISTQRSKSEYKIGTPKRKEINKVFPEHFDTEHWGKNRDKIEGEKYVYITQKLHGTSVRLGHQRVYDKNVPWWGRPIDFFFPSISEKLFSKSEYTLIAGSRRVVKNAPNLQGFYKKDIYNEALEKYGNVIPKGYVVYGELIGWAGDKPIQKNYTYRIPQGHFELYVYRISNINEDGYSVDLSFNQMVEFCNSTGLKYCPLIMECRKSDLDQSQYDDTLLNIRLHDQYPNCVQLDDTSPCDEGICIRIDGIKPKIYKHKSPDFLVHETSMIDMGVEDIESVES